LPSRANDQAIRRNPERKVNRAQHLKTLKNVASAHQISNCDIAKTWAVSRSESSLLVEGAVRTSSSNGTQQVAPEGDIKVFAQLGPAWGRELPVRYRDEFGG
ncbi:hypothetical protein, partial [Mesorhizobium sp.]|uniref:hypothetical protein n=1 Tax=Mesorhizobium sp. TaxID=1871066 RepID=UPI0025BE0E01